MMQRQVRVNSRIVPILLGILFFLQLVEPFTGWMILLFGIGGAWIFSYLWARSLSKNLYLTREMRFDWAQVGDQLEERFSIENCGWAPAIWVEIQDHSTLPGHHFNWATGVEAKSNTQWHSQELCTQRGVFTIGPTGLKSGDPFGFFTVELHDRRSQSLMVMPPVVPLPKIEIAPGGRSGEGYPRPAIYEQTVSAGSVREFSPGDSLRWIHWRTTARHQHPFVRIFDGTPAGDWYIFLDLDKNVQLGVGGSSTAEHAIILAASLSARGLKQKRAVGLMANGKEAVWMAPVEGEKQRWDILHALALVEPGDMPLSEFIQRMEHDIRSQSSIILITSSVSKDWVEAILPLIWRGITPTVILLDRTSFGGNESSQSIQMMLNGLGIPHYIITKDILDRPEAHPGRGGRWEWRITPSGRAILVRKPGDMTWKVLT